MRKKWLYALVFVGVAAVGAPFGCSGGCGIEPPPADMPPSQTIEGGIQVRITPGGLQKLTAEIVTLINDAVANQTVGETTLMDNLLGELTLCPGDCPVYLSIPPGGISIEVTSPEYLTIKVSLLAATDLRFRFDPLVGGDMNCTFGLTTDPNDPIHVEADIRFFIRQSDGELRIELAGLHNVSVSGLEFHVTDCGDILTDVLDFFAGVLSDLLDWLDAILGNPIVDWLMNDFLIPWLGPYIDNFLPDPLGLEGILDLGAMLEEFSPGASGALELRLTPGGYVNLLGQGMTLGVITGMNSDSDPQTRRHVPNALGVMEHSEGARCVPPFATFDMNPFVPTEMELVPGRDTFSLNVAPELNGTNDNPELVYSTGPLAGQVADMGIGISRHFLNLTGFHAINSGALCLTIGTAQVDMITVGLVSILIQSMSDLIDADSGDAPMQLVIRPQWPIEFSIGQGTQDDPLLDIVLKDFRVDMYPFLHQRYTRALTLAMDLRVGINLDTALSQDASELLIVPEIVGLDQGAITVRVHNSELVAESPEELETLLPTIMDLILPLLTGALGEGIPLPELQGFALDSIEFKPNSSNSMLLILASIHQGGNPLPIPPVRTKARIAEVSVPPPEQIRAALMSGDSEALPAVTVVLGAQSVMSNGQFEWQWRLDGGIWRPYSSERPLVIRDRSLVFQGWHTLDVRARLKGKPLTADRQPVRLKFLVDSMPPIFKTRVEDGNLVVGGFDLITPRSDLLYSFRTGPTTTTQYSHDNTLQVGLARSYARASGGKLGVRVKDEAGNVQNGSIDLGVWSLTVEDEGHSVIKPSWGCSAGGHGSGLGWALMVIALLAGLAFFRRSRRWGLGGLVIVCVAAFGLGACKKKAPGGPDPIPCTDDEDCAHLVCPDGEIPMCIDGVCQCMTDIPLGTIGGHTSMVVVSGPVAYVSAYSRSYGDLIVARFQPPGVVPHRPYTVGGDGWEFVDGVPPGPVVVPGSDVRGGVRNRGPDVGTYTSIGANLDRHPVVAYHDKEVGGLKYAWFDGSQWHIHVVDDGGSDEPEEGNAGWYNELSLRTSNNAPGIAYMAPLVPTGDASEPFACQLRYAQADQENPTTPAAWTIYIIDDVVVPPAEEGAPIEDWPLGTGLFVSVTRKADDMPVVAYYDSLNGNLMFSEMILDSNNNRRFTDPVIIDGEDDQGQDTGDVGIFPTVAVDSSGVNLYHFAYADATLERLYYFNTYMQEPEIIDDGYRLEQNETTGLPMPVFHYVGWDTQMLVLGEFVLITYQDSTDHELRLASRENAQSNWNFEVVAGDEDPFIGAYGFYTDIAVDGGTAYIASFVINQHAEPDLLGGFPVKFFVEIFARTLGPQ